MASVVKPKNEKEQEKILVGALDECRIKYQNTNTDYANLGSKIFTLIATELVITTFIFTFKLSDKKPLFSFANLSSVIFFGIGLGLVSVALGILFWATTSNSWMEPAEKKELKQLNYQTHIDFLEETKDDYLEAIVFCRKRFHKRRIAFDASVTSFIIGAIILMVIKIGG